MPGTKAGAKKAAETMRRKFGDDYFHKLASNGGRNSFGADHERARLAGQKSKRKPRIKSKQKGTE